MHGLDWYDYGARFHDPATGRWFSVYPLAHKYYSISPYVYCANNPVNLIDPDGRDGVATIDKENKTIVITQNFYYNSSNSEFKSKLITETSPRVDYPSDVDINSSTGWARPEGFDVDGWHVTFEQNFIACESDDAVRVEARRRPIATHVKTLPYPGFPTDMQPQITVALGLASGISIVTESIFENRFKYVDQLMRMGANIKVEGSAAIVNGVERYSGADVSAPDLRAGAALVIAGLTADGFTTIDNIHYIERGYEDFDIKLRELGAQIEKVNTDEEVRKFELKMA
jgi:hypothetical protein